MSNKIALDALTKEFGSVVAVDNVSLEIPKGEFVSLVGPSGSGKTTLLRMIAGLESVNSGKILFEEDDMTELSPQDRPLSMVFQDIALYPHMSCRENVGYGLKIHGVPKDERDRRIDEAARKLQIEDQIDKDPSELSGGQQQRVALGRAFVEDPEVLLLDEPMSDLDAKLKEDLRVEFQRLHRELDSTMIYVTHDQNEAMMMSDRIAVMRSGTVEQFDTPENIFNDPVSEHVATFIGTPSTNIIECEINGSIAECSGFQVPIPEDAKTENSIQVGIRPQHLEVGNGEVEFDITIDVIEPMGTEYAVHTVMDGSDTQIDVVTPNVSNLSAGDKITVSSSLDQVYFFDTDGQRIHGQLSKEGTASVEEEIQ